MSDKRAILAILDSGTDDWVMLHEVLWYTTHDERSPTAKSAVAHVLQRLFEEALMVPGDLGETGFEDWDGTPSTWLKNALAQLDQFGWKPMGAGFWLRLTDHGERVAHEPRTT